ncbi:Cas1p-domain-containing protein [Cyathus striatus]|nr:Cas1p-domain-containing protein [Cyathus striatus]
MSTIGTAKFTLNPSWPRNGGIIAVLLALFFGVSRYLIFDSLDPMHCGALLSKGTWLDSVHQNWQPQGCMLHAYTEADGASCLSSRDIIFVGDSVTRQLFYHTAHVLDSSLPTSPPNDERKHSDHDFQTKDNTGVSFIWDPFLNTTRTTDIITGKSGILMKDKIPALFVIGSGLWYLRYANTSGGIPAWEANMERVLRALSQSLAKAADQIVVLPVEQVYTSKLTPERAASMHPWDIDAMNSDLLHRISPPSETMGALLWPDNAPRVPEISFPIVFNEMLEPTETQDGLHFTDPVIKAQANILLNLRCNDVLPKSFPLDKTCCNRYQWPSFLQFIVILSVIAWGAYVFYTVSLSATRAGKTISLGQKELVPMIISIAIGLIYLADRTGFWLKEQKQFNPWSFSMLCISALVIGLVTVKRGDKDLGFLNRDQTDEWKGWMQVAILIYHYFGASKVSGIYNPIRVLVASYLFMTGYGHTTFYLRKADFGFLRISQVLVRLNFLTVLLAYTMNTDYISYYFAPLVSFWFMVIYGTMAIGSQLNDRLTFVLCKIFLSASMVTWSMWQKWPLEVLFGILSRFCRIQWSAREWTFRVTLDIKALTDHLYWPLAVKVSLFVSLATILWFFAFELLQESKFAYNFWHPYVSFLPVVAYIILRNATVVQRSAFSRAFAFIGKCSLETFIIQYHFWLAGDTKGILLVIPGTRWRPVNFIITTTMFIYVCDRVAYATGELTGWICGSAPKAVLPLPNTTSIDLNAASRTRDEGELELDRIQALDGVSVPAQTVTNIGMSDNSLKIGVKLSIIISVMWVLNVLWTQ